MIIYNPTDFELGFSEVHQKAQTKIRGLEIIQTLGQVDIIKVLDCLVFEKKDSFDQKVGCIFAYGYSVVIYRDPVLLLDLQARLAKLMFQCVLIYLL